MITLGVMGCGNMGGALLRGFAADLGKAGIEKLYAYDRNPERMKVPGVTPAANVNDLIRSVDYLVLAFKPDQIAPVLDACKNALSPEKVIVSVAAGLSVTALRELSGGCSPVVRVMPNTPALVGEGVFGLCADDKAVTPQQEEALVKAFSVLGRVYRLPEKKFNALSALAGCGPAFVFHFVDALVEAGVSLGLSRKEATEMAYATTKGSVILAEQTGQHLSILREQVSSPGGMTIEGLNHLDRTAVRGHMIDAVKLSYQKGMSMGAGEKNK